MPDSTVVAVVSTPLQWINANEALEQLDLGDAIILVLSRDYSLVSFESLPISSRVKEFVFHRGPGKNETNPFRRLKRGLRPFREAALLRSALGVIRGRQLDALVIGHSRDALHRHVANVARAARYVLVDDGAQILNTALDITTGDVQRGPVRGFGRRIIESLAGLKSSNFPEVELFTAYELEVANTRCHRNSYALLRQSLGSIVPTVGQVWIIGQYFYRDGLMSPEQYFSCLEWLVDTQYGGMDVSYILHPRERQCPELEQLAALGIRVIRLNRSVEMEIMTAARCPERIATFYSSVFQTSRSVFDDRIVFDIIDPEPECWANEKAVELVEQPYRYLREQVKSPHRLFRLEPRVRGKKLVSSSSGDVIR